MSESTKLANELRREGGFEVYMWGGGREDLNDWFSHSDQRHLVYVRALHNLRGYEDVTYNSPLKDSINYGVARQPDTNKVGSEMLEYGLLPKQRIVEVKQPPIPRRIKKKGIAGFFGTKETVLEAQEPQIGTFYESPQPLSDVVLTDRKDDAHFALFTIRSDIKDNVGRPPGSYPTLTVVAPRELVVSTVNFIQENPRAYYEFIRSLMPKDKFPNVNRGIIDAAQPSGSILVVDASQIPRCKETLGNRVEFEPETLYNLVGRVFR